jgi:phosphate transport system substrate-binding protein
MGLHSKEEAFMKSTTRRVTGGALALAVGMTLAHAETPAQPGEPPNANKSIWTQNVTGFRKEHSVAGGYKKQWDLGDLPHYEPRHHLTGKIRVWGSNYIKDGPLGEYWRTEFRKFQPDVEIEYNLPTTGIAVPALAAKTADVAIGRKPILMDLLTYEQVYHHPLTEMALVTGSYDVYGWMPAFIIVVNKDNPIERISLKQLDGVFGGQRNGGYVGSVWRTDYPCKRGADENIRTWGQLGLTGEWADKPIHPGGQTLRGNNTTQLSDKILCGSDQWAESYQAYANYITGNGKIVPWSTQARDALEADKYGIYYVSPLSMSPKLKELAIQDHDGGPYVKRSLETIRDHSYPLYNLYYVYFNRDPGKPADPKVEEFVRFLLSREGQQEVQHEGRYMPLTGAMVQEELKKLD